MRRPKASKRIAAISKVPAPHTRTHRQGSRSCFRTSASKRVTMDFCKASLSTPGPFRQPIVISVCHRLLLRLLEDLAFRRAPEKNLRFVWSLRVFKDLHPDVSARLHDASQRSPKIRAVSRKTLQTFRKASHPQGILGGGPPPPQQSSSSSSSSS